MDAIAANYALALLAPLRENMDKPKSYNDWHSSLQGFEGLRHANCCKISYEAGQQSRQAELDQAYEDIETFAQAHQRECDIKVQIANELKEKDKRIEEVLFQMRQQALSLKEDCDGYKDPVGICQSEGIDWCVRFLEKVLRGEHE